MAKPVSFFYPQREGMMKKMEITKRGRWKLIVPKLLIIFLFLFQIGFVGIPKTNAATTLTATIGSWSTIGLDKTKSNPVTDGPNEFLVQVRVTNTGLEAATDVLADFDWTPSNTYIYLDPYEVNPKSIGTINPGQTKDVFFLINVERTISAYYTSGSYDVNISGGNFVATSASGVLTVKELIKESRHHINSITASTTTPTLGQTFTITVNAKTSSSSYPNIEIPIIDYNPSVIQPIGVTTTWDGSSSDNLVLHNAGGNPMIATWTFKAVGVGSSQTGSFIFDQTNETSDNHHYNDYTSGPTIVVAGYSISGMKFNDLNGNEIKDTGEDGLSNWTIYIDANQNGSKEPGEQSTTTGGGGSYSFTNLSPGTYRIREVGQNGWNQTCPASGYYDVTITNTNVTGINFGNQQTMPVLHITKGDSPDPVQAGGTLTYTIEYWNSGNADATGVVITETYDSNVHMIAM
ncbi:MAG: hypothetical protein NTZ85_02020 [Bacteroidia bacterium]|nr:hypothetical protein [Bacteroidia bacterium]